MKKLLLFLVCILTVFSVFASPEVNARVIDPTSPLYDYMDTLYALCSKAKPNTNRPWSEGEARQILSRIDKSSLSGVALDLYNNAFDIINEGQRWNISEDFGFGVLPELNAEVYAHKNDKEFVKETDWVRSYAERKPWVAMRFDFSVKDFFWTTSDIAFRMVRGSTDDYWTNYIDAGLAKMGSDGQWYVGTYVVDEDSGLPVVDEYFKKKLTSNVRWNTFNFDFAFPHRAIASVGGKGWNASINRDRMKIGDAHLGNLLVDDYDDYNHYFRLSLFGNEFKYDWYIMTFDSVATDGENPDTEGRMFFIHTLDFRIAERVGLKISENVIYKYSTFNFDFINPANIYHNLNNHGMFNAIALLEFNAVPFKNLNFYGQYVLDQAQAPNEDDSQSDASGLILGAEYTVPVLGGVLESYAEFADTTPLLYRRDEVDFIRVTRYYHQGSLNKTESGGNEYYGHYPEFNYIGFPFGGDTMAFTAGAKYIKPGIFSAELSALALQKGEVNIYKSHNTDGDNTDDANLRGKTPSGDVITRALVITLKGDVDMGFLFRWPGVSAFLEADFVTRGAYEKASKTYLSKASDIQASVGVSCKL